MTSLVTRTLLGAIVAGLVVSSGALPAAQAPALVWVADDVAEVVLGQPNCIRQPRVNGFGFGQDGTPMVGWTQVEGCGGSNLTYWSEKLADGWLKRQWGDQGFWSGPNGFAHEFAVGADGRPYLFMVGGNATSLTYGTYRADLRAHADGEPYLVATGEHLANHQECVYVTYRPAAGAGQDWPYRATFRGQCLGDGPLRFEGATLVDNVIIRGFDLAMGADSRAHIAYTDGTRVFYVRPGMGPVLVANNLNRFNDDVAIQAGIDGTLHLVVRGFNSVGDNDRGQVGYLQSVDDGATWQFVDWADQSRLTYGLSLRLDAAGAPALAFWRYGSGLIYTTRASGAWVDSRVVAPGFSGTEWVKPPHLRFDAAGVPHIAYYDWTANRIRISSPWIGAPGDAPPVDLGVTGNASPNPTVAGTQVTLTIQVANRAVREASGVRVRVTLPAGITANSLDPSPTSTAGGVLTFDQWRVPGGGVGRDRLAAGATGTITLNVSGLPTGIAEFPVQASATEDDAAPADNDMVLTARVNEASCALPVSGRTAWWPGDGTALNYGGGAAYHGTPVGDVRYGPGAVGQAFVFDGQTGYVNVPNGYDEYYWPLSGSLSVGAWARTTKNDADVQVIAAMDDMANAPCCGSPQGSSAWYLLVKNGVFGATIRNNQYGAPSINLAGHTLVADGAFHHAALVIEPSALQARLYVDGQLEASAALTPGWTMNNGDFEAEQLVIGAAQVIWGIGYRYFFDGAVDDVSLYKRVLTPTEIANAASGPALAACGAPPVTPVNQAPVVVAPLSDVTLVEDALPRVVSLDSVFADPDGDALTYSASSDNPAVLTASVDNAARTLMLTLTPDAFGAAAVMVQATDGGHTATSHFLVTVTPVNDPPYVDQPADVRVVAGTEGVVVLTGLTAGSANELGQVLNVTATSSFEAVTGAVSATLGEVRFTPPARTDVAVANVKVEVVDSGGTANGGLDRTTRTFAVTVLPPVTLTAPAAQHDVTGGTVSVSLGYTAYPDAPLHFTAKGLPPGLSINASTGVIAGTLGTEAGNYTATVTLSDGMSQSSVSFQWQVVLAVIELTVDEAITVTDTVELRPALMLAIDETISVTDAVAVLPSTMIAIDEVITVTDTVGVVTGNTPAGSNTTVVFGGGSTRSVVLTFANVSTPGQTTAQPAAGAPALPSGFVTGAPALIYDISTTAQFAGNVEVCVEYDPAAFKTSDQRLFHHTGTSWTDTTTSNRRDTSTVCGTTTHFSPFAVVEPEAVAPLDGRITGEGKLDDAGGEHAFHLHVSEGSRRRRPNDRLRYEVTTVETVTTPGKSSGKGKAAPPVTRKVERTDRFEATSITQLTFSDEAGFSPGRSRSRVVVDSVDMSGVGRWNGMAGYTFEARAEDHGEPGKGQDTFAITIRSPQGAVVATVDGTIRSGNIQSHKVGQRRPREASEPRALKGRR